MSADRVCNVLFLCTGTSARSILGEAVLDHVGGTRFHGHSAGSHPTGTVHQRSIAVLEAAGISAGRLRSKPWDEFATPDAPRMDFVFTVCDNAAGEACPVWPGHPITAHWGIEDPATVSGTDLQQQAAFEAALRYTRNRIEALINLPLATIDRMTLITKLQGIGAMDGTSAHTTHFA